MEVDAVDNTRAVSGGAVRKTLACALVLLAAVAGADTNGRKVSTTSYPNCFKMVDSTDHVTAKTGLTVTCTRSKNGGSFASCSGSVSEVANGVYCIAGNATDRDTVGSLVFHMTGTAADPRDFEVPITAADPFAYPDTSSTIAAVTTVTTTTTATTCTNLTNAPTAGDFTSTMKTSLNNSTPACSSVSGAVGSVTGNVGGNVVGTVASVVGNVGGNVTGSVGSVTGNVGGNVVGSVASVTAPVTAGTVSDKTGYALTAAYDAAKTASQAGDVMKVSSGTGANQINLSSGHVTNVDTLTTYTGNTPQTGDSFARLGAPAGASIAADIAAFSAPSAATVASTVWGSYHSAYPTTGTFGYYLDAAISTRSTLSAANLTVVSPASQTGALTLVHGDDYNASDTGREIAWTSTGWPDLTGASVTFTARRFGAVAITKAGTVVTPTGTAKIRVDLTSADTLAMMVGTDAYKYDVQVTLANGRKFTAVLSTITVQADYTP